MLYVLLLILILYEELSPSTFVYDKHDSHGDCYEEAEDDDEDQFAHQRPEINLVYYHSTQNIL